MVLDGKSRIKVEMTGADGIRRKDWVDYDAKLYKDKYFIDPTQIFLSYEPGFLGTGGKTVPTIAFRANSVYPVPNRGNQTIPDPDMFGENIAKAAHAIAVLRETGESVTEKFMFIMLALAIIAGAVGAYYGYQDNKAIGTLDSDVQTLSTTVSSMHSDQETAFNTTTGLYGNSSGSHATVV